MDPTYNGISLAGWDELLDVIQAQTTKHLARTGVYDPTTYASTMNVNIIPTLVLDVIPTLVLDVILERRSCLGKCLGEDV